MLKDCLFYENPCAPFTRAIAQSGANLGPGLNNSPKTEEKAFKVGLDIATKLGCTEGPEILGCLQSIEDGYDILKANDYKTIFANIDSILGEESFLPNLPRDILKTGKMNAVDLIIGVNHDEGLEAIVDLLKDPGNDSNFEFVRDNWDTFGPYMLFDQDIEDITSEVVDLSNQVAEFYLPDGGVENYNAEHLDGIVKMFTDAWYWYTTDDWTRLAVQNNLTVYRYINSYDSILSLLLFINGVPNMSDYGVCHADELLLLFGGALSSIFTEEDITVSKNFVSWWTNFAKYG